MGFAALVLKNGCQYAGVRTIITTSSTGGYDLDEGKNYDRKMYCKNDPEKEKPPRSRRSGWMINGTAAAALSTLRLIIAGRLRIVHDAKIYMAVLIFDLSSLAVCQLLPVLAGDCSYKYKTHEPITLRLYMDRFYKVANNCVDFVRLIVICIMRCPLNHDEWKTGTLLPSLVIGSNLTDLVLVSKQ